MTEAERLACEDPRHVLNWIREGRETPNKSPRLVRVIRQEIVDSVCQRATQRTLRLLCCACCRRHWHLFPTPERAVIELAEQVCEEIDCTVHLSLSEYIHRCRAALHGDAVARYQTWHRDLRNVLAHSLVSAAVEPLNQPHYFQPGDGLSSIAEAVGWVAVNTPQYSYGPNSEKRRNEVARQEAAHQSALLRDVFGNPFRPVAFDPAWRTDTAVSLARGMYESRDFGAMPILADALQDAGCEDEQVLKHCREPGPHVRGCWVCDLVLGKV